MLQKVIPLFLQVSKRIELVTNMNVTSRHGALPYQATNYGLAGLVETHHDSWGYEKGVELVPERKHLVTYGDVIATFMGWLDEVSAGGGTGFNFPDFESVINPTKGSAAFWMDLDASHEKDFRATHGGCPVIKGSKWILNKWISSFDQWKVWKCGLNKTDEILPYKGSIESPSPITFQSKLGLSF